MRGYVCVRALLAFICVHLCMSLPVVSYQMIARGGSSPTDVKELNHLPARCFKHVESTLGQVGYFSVCHGSFFCACASVYIRPCGFVRVRACASISLWYVYACACVRMFMYACA